jgi:putative ABC transport system substrate-binding protein
MNHWSRRQFVQGASVAGLGLVAGCGRLPWQAQPVPMPTIGYLHCRSRESAPYLVDAFYQGLKEAGYVEGQNFAVEYRWAEGHFERLPGLAAELVNLQVP